MRDRVIAGGVRTRPTRQSGTAMNAKKKQIAAGAKGAVPLPATALEEKQELLRHHVRMLGSMSTS